jgi:hypothetical protein
VPTEAAQRVVNQGSIIVPAFNEAGVLGAHLRSLLAPPSGANARTVVICNGCTDATADVARSVARELGVELEVIELAEAGKARALRAAAELDLPFPRLYLDADVECPGTTARALLDAVRGDGVDLAVPARRLDLAGATAAARAYHRTWSSLPWVMTQLAGRGAYAVSEAVRGVVDALPADLVADDRLVTTSVPVGRAVVLDVPVTIRPPRSVPAIVRVRSRVYRGNQLTTAPAHDLTAGRRWLKVAALTAHPARWPGLLVFLAVAAWAKGLSRWSARHGGSAWERDGLARAASGEAA